MIVSRTPLRLAFFGGGTDLPRWLREHGGSVLGATIDKYCYVSCRRMPPLFTHRLRVVWSRTENCQHASEVRHPAVREVLHHLGIEHGVAIHHDGDLPARSGMGASSAFTVGLLHALYALRGYMPGKRQLAAEARDIEQGRLGEFVGAADHALIAHGGLSQVTCAPDGEVRVKPLTVAPARVRALSNHLMLFFVGARRPTGDVLQAYTDAADRAAPEMKALRALVEEGVAVLNGDGDLATFGRLLDEGWRVKRGLSAAISTPDVDAAYERARAAGATGGTLVGPGGGGFLLLFVPPERRARVRTMLRPLAHVPFEFESAGTEIIFADPEKESALDAEDPASAAVDPLTGRRFPEGF
jgi:D-glycero-alpha-D-manno-heptose-7-phosphate kinase